MILVGSRSLRSGSAGEDSCALFTSRDGPRTPDSRRRVGARSSPPATAPTLLPTRLWPNSARLTGIRFTRSSAVSALLPTLTGGRSEVPLAAIAAELGMTEGAVKMAASRLRKRFGEILREEIAGTLADPADVEEEIRALFAALAR